MAFFFALVLAFFAMVLSQQHFDAVLNHCEVCDFYLKRITVPDCDPDVAQVSMWGSTRPETMNRAHELKYRCEDEIAIIGNSAIVSRIPY